MRKMKDSGIKWIGKIPSIWEIERVKNYFDTISGSGFDLSLQGQSLGQLPIIKASDIAMSGGLIKAASNYLDKKTAVNAKFKIIPANSILFAKIGEAMKKNNRAISLVECCADNNCQAMVPKNIDSKFSFYLFSSIDMNWFDNAGTIPCINNLKLNMFKIPIPSLIEQKLIAEFLDKKCSEIDEITKDLQTQIETLENYKKSVITEAVTKGLNPSVDYNDNKKQWFRGIPKHWIVSRIAAIYKLRNTKVSDRDYPPLSVTMQGVVPQLENAAKSDAHDDRKLVCKGDFAINSRSDRRGSCGIAPLDGSISLINTVLCPLTNMNARYYNWLFHTVEFADEFYKWGHGIVNDLWTTNWQDMKNILIPRPPIQEQKEIANYLDTKCAEIDEIIKNKKEQQETIEEYKKSLIYEYVTGKKEVKNA